MNLSELSRTVDTLATLPSTPAHFSSSIEKLMELLATILEVKGDGWIDEVNKRLGSDFTEEEADAMQPLVSLLAGTVQKGGRVPLISSKPPPEEPPPEEPVIMQSTPHPQVRKRSFPSPQAFRPDFQAGIDAKKAQAAAKKEQIASADKNNAIEFAERRPFSSNNMVKGKAALKKVVYEKPPAEEPRKDPKYLESYILNNINDFMHKITTTAGFNFDKTDVDETSDFKLGANIVDTLKVSAPVFVGPMLAAEAVASSDKNAITPLTTLSKVVVPYRAGVTFAQTLIGLLRFSGAVSPVDFPFWRQLLSCVSAIIEILKGDWKSAALSIAGVYSQNAAYGGIVAKMILNLFLLMDEQYQIHVLHGITAVPKSILVGFALFCFQTFATYEARIATIKILDELLQKIEHVLTENIKNSEYSEELKGKRGLTNITFGTLNLLQKIMHRKEMVCTEAFQGVLEGQRIGENVFLRIFFMLMDIPYTKEDVSRMCKGNPSRLWSDGLFQKEIPCDPIKKSQAALATPIGSASLPAPVPGAPVPGAPVPGAPVLVPGAPVLVPGAPAPDTPVPDTPVPGVPVPPSTSAPGAKAPTAAAAKVLPPVPKDLKITGVSPPIFTDDTKKTIKIMFTGGKGLEVSLGDCIEFTRFVEGGREPTIGKITKFISALLEQGTAQRLRTKGEREPNLPLVKPAKSMENLEIIKGIEYIPIVKGVETPDPKNPRIIGLNAFKLEFESYDTNSIKKLDTCPTPQEGGLRRKRKSTSS